MKIIPYKMYVYFVSYEAITESNERILGNAVLSLDRKMLFGNVVKCVMEHIYDIVKKEHNPVKYLAILNFQLLRSYWVWDGLAKEAKP
jgi:hypothetical protein